MEKSEGFGGKGYIRKIVHVKESTVALGTQNGFVIIYDVQEQKMKWSKKGHNRGVNDLLPVAGNRD